MKKFPKKLLTIASLLMIFVLALAACQPMETPVPIEPPEDVDLETPTEEMTEETPEETAEQVPSITNPRQNIEDGTVIVDQVYMDQQGWVVIHADDGGQPGPVIGYIEVPEGVSNEVVIQVVPEDITPTLYAMLHVDAEPLSEFNFPEGDDAPVTVDGEVVVTSFDAVTDAEMEDEEGDDGEAAALVPRIVNPRQSLQDGNVIIDKVVMDQQGWVVIHADDGGQPGPVIGYIEVPEGVSTEVYIQIVPDEITPTLYAMLHVDAEPLSEFNFPEGDDVPVTVDDEVVTKAFDSVSDADLETGMGEGMDEAAQVPRIVNPRQSLQDGNVIIDKVYMDQGGWVVIHADDGGQPGPVIGYIEVPEGISTEVYIQVVPDEITPTLYAMLHVDAEPLSEFNFPEGDDVPVTVDGEVVTKAFDSVSDADLETGNGE